MYTSVSPHKNLVVDYFSIVDKLKKKGYNIIEVTNNLAEDKDEYIFELQFHTKESLEVKELNHKLYEKQRLEHTSVKEGRRISKEMTENGKSIKIPHSI